MVFSKIVMPKTWLLCTSAESNLRDGVLGKVEKNKLIVLPGKGGHSGRMPPKTVPSTQEDLVRSFTAMA